MSTEENQDYEVSEKIDNGVRPTSEEKPLERNLASDNEQTDADSDKLKDDEVVTSGILANPVNAAQILPMLQNLLLHNDMQRERLMGLIQLYDPTAENMNPVVNTEDGQIAATKKRVDHISRLPDEILHHILSFLAEDGDIRQAASTSILSKRWRNQFTFVEMIRIGGFSGTKRQMEMLKRIKEDFPYLKQLEIYAFETEYDENEDYAVDIFIPKRFGFVVKTVGLFAEEEIAVAELFWETHFGLPTEENQDDSDKLKDDEVVTFGILANPVNLLSGDAAQILPMLQNLLLHNDMQRERLMGLIQLYDPTAENVNPVVNTEDGQIAATETDLSSVVPFLEQSVPKLEEEELENQKKANAQLEDEIKGLTLSSDAENHD